MDATEYGTLHEDIFQHAGMTHSRTVKGLYMNVGQIEENLHKLEFILAREFFRISPGSVFQSGMTPDKFEESASSTGFSHGAL